MLILKGPPRTGNLIEPVLTDLQRGYINIDTIITIMSYGQSLSIIVYIAKSKRRYPKIFGA